MLFWQAADSKIEKQASRVAKIEIKVLLLLREGDLICMLDFKTIYDCLNSGQDIVHRTQRLITALKLERIKGCQYKLNNVSGSMAAKGLYFNNLANFNDPLAH